jgi:hypothetical protein
MSSGPHQTVVIHEAPGTSGLAIAGLIFAILGWFTCGLLCIPGAFLCLLALFMRGPKGAAIAGLIVGFPGTLFFAFIGLGIIMSVLGIGGAAVSEARRTAQEIEAQNNAMEAALAAATTNEAKPEWSRPSDPEPEKPEGPRRPDPPPAPTTKLTMANFERIKPGINSKSGVIVILGDDYTLISENEFGQGTQFHVKTELLQWQDGLRTIHVTFQNGKVTQKSQFGLPLDDPVQDESRSNVKQEVERLVEEGKRIAEEHWRVQEEKRAEEQRLRQKRDEERRVEEEQQQAKAQAEEEQRRIEEEAKWRTWTTADGKFSVEAKFVKFAAGLLTLEKRDGKTVEVKLVILSDEDQDFVRQRGRK